MTNFAPFWDPILPIPELKMAKMESILAGPGQNGQLSPSGNQKPWPGLRPGLRAWTGDWPASQPIFNPIFEPKVFKKPARGPTQDLRNKTFVV